MKRALAIISFGTSYQTGERALKNIEEHLKNTFLEYDCFRAFTSKRIIQKVKDEQKIQIPTVFELLTWLKEQQYEEVICQPTHMTHGVEFEKMMEQIQRFRGQFRQFKVGYPLLHEEEDCRCCVKLYIKEFAMEEKKRAFVFMGHGRENNANQEYAKLKKILEEMGYDNSYIGTIEGFPSIQEVIGQMKRHSYQNVTLIPFVIVSGRHVYRDMIGNSERAWENQLKRAGYAVDVCMKGLGEYKKIAEIFENHVRKAVEVR